MQPGNGAGYVKHLDFDLEKHAHQGDVTFTGRKLTAILYLNETWEGGQLRAYNKATDGATDGLKDVSTGLKGVSTAVASTDGLKDVSCAVSSGLEDVSTDGLEGVSLEGVSTVDIDPALGRMVLFRRYGTYYAPLHSTLSPDNSKTHACFPLSSLFPPLHSPSLCQQRCRGA